MNASNPNYRYLHRSRGKCPIGLVVAFVSAGTLYAGVSRVHKTDEKSAAEKVATAKRQVAALKKQYGKAVSSAKKSGSEYPSAPEYPAVPSLFDFETGKKIAIDQAVPVSEFSLKRYPAKLRKQIGGFIRSELAHFSVTQVPVLQAKIAELEAKIQNLGGTV